MNTTELSAALCEASKRGLGMTSLAVLVHCAEHQGVTLTKLAALVGRSAANLTGIADRLQERDLVRRRSIRGDRRVWTLELTDHGFGILHNILSLPITTLKTKQHRA